MTVVAMISCLSHFGIVMCVLEGDDGAPCAPGLVHSCSLRSRVPILVHALKLQVTSYKLQEERVIGASEAHVRRVAS